MPTDGHLGYRPRITKKKEEKNVGRFPNVFSLLKIVNDARLHTKQRQVLFPKPSLSAHYLRDGVDPLSWSCYGDQNRIHNQNAHPRTDLSPFFFFFFSKGLFFL